MLTQQLRAWSINVTGSTPSHRFSSAHMQPLAKWRWSNPYWYCLVTVNHSQHRLKVLLAAAAAADADTSQPFVTSQRPVLGHLVRKHFAQLGDQQRLEFLHTRPQFDENAFSFPCRPTKWHYPHPATAAWLMLTTGHATISWYLFCLPGPQQQAHGSVMPKTDGQMDGHKTIS